MLRNKLVYSCFSFYTELWMVATFLPCHPSTSAQRQLFIFLISWESDTAKMAVTTLKL